jgi:WD40 repeat protein
MHCKFLEISSGVNLLPKKFEIIQVENYTYMLKTKDSHVGLLKTLDKWVKTNYSMKESSYSVMLLERPSSPR